MTYKEAVRQFRELYNELYERGADYGTAQEAWAFFTDNLCKNGEITQKQWSTWATPFTYGKRLKVTKRYSC